MTKEARKRKVISDGQNVPSIITRLRMPSALNRMQFNVPREATKLLKRPVNSQASDFCLNGSGMRGMLALLEERPPTRH